MYLEVNKPSTGKVILAYTDVMVHFGILMENVFTILEKTDNEVKEFSFKYLLMHALPINKKAFI